ANEPDTADSPDQPEETPPYSELLDIPDTSGQTPREAIRAVKPEDLGIAGFTPGKTDAYFAAYRDKHPWLTACESAQPESRHLLATIDQTEGHVVSRHEGHAAGVNLPLRVRYSQDPANTNDASRKNSDDAYVTDATGRLVRHRCDATASVINDPDAMATAYGR